MKISRVSKILVLSTVFLLCGSAVAFAASDKSWVYQSDRAGVVDAHRLLLQHPKYEAAVKRIQGISDPKQGAEEERKLINPIFKELAEAIKTVCDARKLTVAMDKRHVLYGGYDVTDDVIQYLKSGSIAHIDGPADGAEVKSIYFIDTNAAISQHPQFPEFAAAARRIKGISDRRQRAEEERKLNESINEALRLAVRKIVGANPVLVLVTMQHMTYFGGPHTLTDLTDHDLTDHVTQWLKSGTLKRFYYSPQRFYNNSAVIIENARLIGHIDPDTVLRGHPKYESIMRQIQGISDPKQRAEEERKLMDPIFKDIDLAIRYVANAKNLSVVYDEFVIHYGGVDLTDAVIKVVKQPKRYYSL